jgi:hypothetical protein
MNDSKSPIVFTLIGLTAVYLFAQSGGDPNTPPPGPPGKVFKTLDEVEARTPLIAGAPGVIVNEDGDLEITQRGSYYLTESLNSTSGHGIVIADGAVSLDLNGFLVTTGAGGSGSAIFLERYTSIHICNGHLSAPTNASGSVGWQSGIGFDPAATLKNVSIRNISFFGFDQVNSISTSNDRGLNSIENCQAFNCGQGFTGDIITKTQAESTRTGYAMRGQTVSDCRGESLGGVGVWATTVSNSVGVSEGTSNEAHGIRAATVNNCRGIAVGGVGIRVETGTVNHSYGVSVNESGIVVSNGSVANSTGTSSQAIGIAATNGTISYCRGIVSGGDGTAIFGNIVVASTDDDGDSVLVQFGGSKHLGTP